MSAAPARGPASARGWFLLVALGFGITTWAAFLYIGLRARRRSWLAWAAVYGALLVVWGVLDTPTHPNPTASGVAAIAAIIAWLGGTVHAAVVRKEAGRRIRPSDGSKLDAARERIERRATGRRLAAKDPLLAREVGVGRPDVYGADDYGLVDVNHASPAALCRLPGITPEIAQSIAENRESVGFFKSAEELGVSLNLAPSLVDEIQDYAVFL